jgi:hypothetical protein
MATTAEPGTGVLVIRAWRQPDGPLCARVAAVAASTTEPPHWQACVGVDQILVVVQCWLQRLVPEGPVAPDD